MAYVACDACGGPIGGDESMADDAREARRWARVLGAVRKNGKDYCGTYVHGCGATGPT